MIWNIQVKNNTPPTDKERAIVVERAVTLLKGLGYTVIPPCYCNGCTSIPKMPCKKTVDKVIS